MSNVSLSNEDSILILPKLWRWPMSFGNFVSFGFFERSRVFRQVSPDMDGGKSLRLLPEMLRVCKFFRFPILLGNCLILLFCRYKAWQQMKFNLKLNTKQRTTSKLNKCGFTKAEFFWNKKLLILFTDILLPSMFLMHQCLRGVSQCNYCGCQEHEAHQVDSEKIQIHCSEMKAHCPGIILIVTSVFRTFCQPILYVRGLLFL